MLKKHFFIPLLVLLTTCAPEEGAKQIQHYEFEHPSMGSMFKVVVYANDSLQLARVVSRAFDHLDTLNLIMSDYLPHSELMQLSRTSGKNEYVTVSPELEDVLRQSEYWYDWSNGIFDVTIGPFSQLWRRAKRQDELPGQDLIKKASASVGFSNVEIDSNKVRLNQSNMMLDFGGIAKGYAVDQIFKSLQDGGYSICLVDGGGDLRVGDSPPNKEGWEIKIQPFIGNDSTIQLSNQAIATSGDFYRSLQIDGKRYSHIINPSTGYGITAARAVSVISENCTTADVLASIFSIAGPDNKGLNDKVPLGSRIMIFENEDSKTMIFTIEGIKLQSDSLNHFAVKEYL
ncbi:MAG: FAD:protein FMN transferase [Bacteroidota bacterium]